MTITRFEDITPFSDFAQVVDPAVYAPAPEDSVLCLTDIVGSTRAIAEGRYKQVNFAGAACIAALYNALGRQPLAFVFGGDGATLLVPAAEEATARAALAATATWVAEELQLTLRAGMVPVADIRAGGADLRIARFQASDAVTYAMFAGGGTLWAEGMLRQGRYGVGAAPSGTRPDLSGLSCRWRRFAAPQGVMLSILAQPRPGADGDRFQALVHRIIRQQSFTREGHPVPAAGPGFSWPPEGLELEARATRTRRSLGGEKRFLGVITLLAWVLDKTGWPLGKFDPRAYRRYTTLNSDFRKFDDCLRMTVDCAPETAEAIEAILREAHAAGLVNYGLHRQREAQLTCFVPSILSDDHFHFVDGAAGGYAEAARLLKQQRSADG